MLPNVECYGQFQFQEQFTAAAAGGFAVDQNAPRVLAAECDEF
jgi:hypothetical protein